MDRSARPGDPLPWISSDDTSPDGLADARPDLDLRGVRWGLVFATAFCVRILGVEADGCKSKDCKDAYWHTEHIGFHCIGLDGDDAGKIFLTATVVGL